MGEEAGDVVGMTVTVGSTKPATHLARLCPENRCAAVCPSSEFVRLWLLNNPSDALKVPNAWTERSFGVRN